MLFVDELVDGGGGESAALELQLLEQQALAYDETDGEASLLPADTDETPLDEIDVETFDEYIIEPAASPFTSKLPLVRPLMAVAVAIIELAECSA